MGMNPIPYKYFIAPSLFGYIAYSLKSESMSKKIWVLMIPAILYGILRCYWLYMIMSGKNPFTIKEAYDLGFFTINEMVFLFFNLILSFAILRKTRFQLSQTTISFGTKKNWDWLKTLPRVFIGLTITHLILIFVSLLTLGQHDRIFYYPSLIINSLFVYWIGFIGYSKPRLLFFKPLVKIHSSPSENTEIYKVLKKAMEEDKVFKNPKLTSLELTSLELASQLNISMNELTKYLNGQFGVNFSQYLNKYRTEEAIRLMKTELSDKYKLESLALEAGFNSKSSFYKIFKEQTGQTPSIYMKSM